MSQRGTFLVFEGIDVSGKSTQARRVAELHDALFTFEPGDTPLGVDLRHWVLDAATPMNPATEALLMLADRAHHVHSVIEPALARGHAVVSDRYYASTLAYQGYGRGVDLARLQSASELAIGTCRADATILLDIPLEVVNERRAHDEKDRFESADLAFHERVRQGYLELANELSWIVIDGARSTDEVAQEIDERVAHLPW
ncbi:MAG TPA: dTMP kinase [Acidimicrobiales bacterium]|nr:dTMP kinase [Acidimicrobiales bacterium]